MEKAKLVRPVFPAGRRIVAVSDIHGNLPFFRALMDKIGLTPDDILIFLHSLQRGDAAVDKNQMLRLHNGGHGPQPGPLLGKGVSQIPAQEGQVLHLVEAPLHLD